MGEHQRLKQLILGEELAELNSHAERVAALESRHAELPRQLPDLLVRAQRGDGRRRLARALATPVADALGEAVESQRQRIVDVLFPVIGPAIRKAIAEALRDFTENFNRALESSFTPRGLRWRLESWRTGIPYAQVVLRHSLRYRTDHLFVIDRDNGLVLARVSAPELPDLDADAIAGMLTAIGDFVRDSVGAGDSGSLDSASVGEYVVWVLQGPRANLAAFLRGTPPTELRLVLRQHLERIHQRFDEGASDDAALRDGLHLERIDAQAQLQLSSGTTPRRWPLVTLALFVLAGIGFWQWREWTWQQRIADIEHRLSDWPGLHLDRIEGRRWRSVRVVGLIDGDADPPSIALRDMLPAEVEIDLSLRGFLSTDDAIVLMRLRRELDLPSGVQASVHDGVASLQGSADASWIASAKTHAARVVGLVALDTSLLRANADPDAALQAEWRRLAAAVPDMRVHFVRELDVRDVQELQPLVAAVQRLAVLAPQLQRRLTLTCRGHNDEPGTATTNRGLRERRARWLCDQLRDAGIAAALLRTDDGDAANRPMIDARAASLGLDAAPAEGE